jgi:hypothetical protein
VRSALVAQLLPLPCGCVIDADAYLLYADGSAECPWCRASFPVVEWVAWLAHPDAAPMWLTPEPWPVRRVVTRLEALASDGGGR